VASARYIPTPWPEELLLDEVITQAAGLFIFVDTIALTLETCDYPTEYLKATLKESTGTTLTALCKLYKLYSRILSGRRVQNNALFRRVIGTLLVAAPYRPLCEDTIAQLARVPLDLVKMSVDDLSSLLYHDERANKGIRVRHSSISEFFLRDNCDGDYHVNSREANVELGVACLNTMVEKLQFNICKLDDSRLANAKVTDLNSRIKENISDALNYSAQYWSEHLSHISDNGNQRVWESLRKFFEGPYALFWIEALSVMGMVPIAVPSLRRVISTVVKVSTCNKFACIGDSNLV
jgi:hypothetical protein